jgi:hypothetical protein
MRRMLAGSLALLLFASAPPSDTLMSWDGVEVVTNDFDSVNRIRKAAQLPPGTLLDFVDPQFPAICERIRKELASSNVNCSNLIGPKLTPEGPNTAVYIVEVNIADREPRRCPTGDSLPEAVRWAYESGQGTRGDVLDGSVVREFVNDKNYLDYDDPGLSDHAAGLHAATQHYETELVAAVASCDPSLRGFSLDLLRFFGDPQRFVRLAGAHINDWHLAPAQAANRFLVTFADFIPPAEMPGLASEACKGLQEGGFFVRSNSVTLLNAWRKRKLLSFDQLAPDCQRQVRDIARTSIADQIAVPARELSNQPAR